MRIDRTSRSSSLSRATSTSASASGFSVTEQSQMSTSAPASIGRATSIDAILALQAVEDPLFAKKKAVRRGNQLLDTLENIKGDLLVGRVSEGRLHQLMSIIGQARDRNLPDLDGVLDDIELRARVELAKFGRYPA